MPKFASNLDLQKNELQNARLHNLSGAPSSPVEGQIYWNSTGGAKHLYIYNGSSWVQLDGLDNNAVTYIADQDAINANNLTDAVNTLNQSIADGDDNTYTNALNAVADFPLDQFSPPTGDLSMNSHKITNVATPSGSLDAANKSYVDSVVQGLDIKQSVKCASSYGAAYTLGTGSITMVDGVALSNGDRILLKDQVLASENGIYIANGSGNVSRAADFVTGTASGGAFVFVEQGTTQAESGWVCTTDGAITTGSTSITWVQFSGAGQITAGAGLTKSGNTLSVTNPKLKWVGDCATSAVWTITHNLGTQDLVVSVYEKATMTMVICDIVHTNSNTTTITFASAPSSAQYRAVIIG